MNCSCRGPCFLRFTFWNQNIEHDSGCFDLSHCLVSGLQEMLSLARASLWVGFLPEGLSASFPGLPRHPVVLWSPGNTCCCISGPFSSNCSRGKILVIASFASLGTRGRAVADKGWLLSPKDYKEIYPLRFKLIVSLHCKQVL